MKYLGNYILNLFRVLIMESFKNQGEEAVSILFFRKCSVTSGLIWLQSVKWTINVGDWIGEKSL